MNIRMQMASVENISINRLRKKINRREGYVSIKIRALKFPVRILISLSQRKKTSFNFFF